MPVGFLRVYRQFSIWVKVGRVMQRQNNTPLTPEQRKLAEKYHNLIFYFMNRKGLDQEEFYDILAIALCKAARLYDPSEYTFTTYCYRCFENALRMHIRDNKRRVQSAPFPHLKFIMTPMILITSSKKRQNVKKHYSRLMSWKPPF